MRRISGTRDANTGRWRAPRSGQVCCCLEQGSARWNGFSHCGRRTSVATPPFQACMSLTPTTPDGQFRPRPPELTAVRGDRQYGRLSHVHNFKVSKCRDRRDRDGPSLQQLACAQALASPEPLPSLPLGRNEPAPPRPCQRSIPAVSLPAQHTTASVRLPHHPPSVRRSICNKDAASGSSDGSTLLGYYCFGATAAAAPSRRGTDPLTGEKYGCFSASVGVIRVLWS